MDNLFKEVFVCQLKDKLEKGRSWRVFKKQSGVN